MRRFSQLLDAASVEIPSAGEWIAHHDVDGDMVEVTLLREGMEDWDADRFAEFGVSEISPAAEPSEGQQFATRTLGLPVDGVVTEAATYEDIPPPPVPEFVTQLQFRRALRHLSLYDAVIGYVNSQDAETIEAFDYASNIRRDSPLLNAGANSLLGSEAAGQAKLDEAFRYADTVVE